MIMDALSSNTNSTESTSERIVVVRPNMDHWTDLQLIDALNEGDAGAFDALYGRYRDWVVNLSFRMSGDRDLALDVLQESFLYLLKKFPGFQLTSSMKSFLYPVVKNLTISHCRRRQRFTGTESIQFLVDVHSEAHPSAQSTDALDLALSLLSRDQRETLMLRVVDGLELAEIATALEIPVGTVKSRLHNALATLRRSELVKNYFGR